MKPAPKPHTNPKDIDYYPGPVATDAHCSAARVKLAWGALGTAKTTWLCWRAFYLAKHLGEQGISLRAVLMRDTYRNLVDSTLQTWLSWFPEGQVGFKSLSNPVDYRLYAGGQWHDVLFRHGQSAQDASAFLSTEYGFIGLEEVAPAYIPGGKLTSPGIAEEVFDMALSRLRQRGVVEPELAITCNSPPLTHWTSKRIIDIEPSSLRKMNWAHWNFPITDNAKNLRPGYYDELFEAWKHNQILIRRFLKGERVPTFVGIPRFNLDALDKLRDTATKPDFWGFLTPSPFNVLGVRLEANPKGWVAIWKPPTLGRSYVLGADVAEGIEGGDYSAAFVIDRETLEICAAFHGHLEPELYGQELGKLGRLYNNARIGIENNNHGLTALVALRNSGYSSIFYQRNIATRSENQRERMGIMTTGHSKPILIDGVGEYLGNNPVIPDLELINELMSFGVMENGSTAAQEGCFDDRVMALALALYVNKMGGLESIFPALNQQRQEAAA